MQLSRRHFIQTTALAAAAAGISSTAWAQTATKPKIAVQLYSVRDDSGKDFDATLEKIAKMGFEGVEFAGYFNYNGKPKELRKRLDDLKLKAVSTHIGTGSFRGDELKKTIEFAQIIGLQYLVVPGDGDFTNSEKSKALAETFNVTALALKSYGMACGYHNHTHEFDKEKETGKTFYDLFAERTIKEVVLEQDCGWTAYAKLNPVDLMKKYPGRFRLQHYKPTVVEADKNTPSKKAYFGQDSVDWVTVLAASKTIGGMEWAILEQEAYPDGKSPMECTEISFAGMKKIW
jgi:sugar phosphate isomerase/epimerase